MLNLIIEKWAIRTWITGYSQWLRTWVKLVSLSVAQKLVHFEKKKERIDLKPPTHEYSSGRLFRAGLWTTAPKHWHVKQVLKTISSSRRTLHLSTFSYLPTCPFFGHGQATNRFFHNERYSCSWRIKKVSSDDWIWLFSSVLLAELYFLALSKLLSWVYMFTLCGNAIIRTKTCIVFEKMISTEALLLLRGPRQLPILSIESADTGGQYAPLQVLLFLLWLTSL